MAETRARRILIDGSMAKGGGGFTYLVNVVPCLARTSPHDRFQLLTRSRRLAESIPAHANLDVQLLPEAGLREQMRFLALEAPQRAAAWGADLYYSAGEYAPLHAPCPVIASFQNPNVFTSIRQGWPMRQRLRLRTLRALAKLSAWRCDRILFVSEDSSRWMGDAIGLPEAKRGWLHHGIDADAWRPRTAESPRRFILSVSSIYRYKNYVRLIEAFAALARRHPRVPDLVIIGDNQDQPYAKKMEAARCATGDLARRIHILGEVPYADVKRYYQEAALFVFPSYLETFGIPLIEAMASDVPVVASDLPIFHEIARDAAFYANPHQTASIARAMEEALYAEGAREVMVKRGRERVRQFTWERASTRLLALFESVLGERTRRAAQPSSTRRALPTAAPEAA